MNSTSWMVCIRLMIINGVDHATEKNHFEITADIVLVVCKRAAVVGRGVDHQKGAGVVWLTSTKKA